MSQRMNEAEKLYAEGFNCSQAVAAVFSEKYGYDKLEILRLACGFGGGMRCGETCGAVSGAIMVIGFKYGHGLKEQETEKRACYSKTVEFIDTFRKRNQTTICKNLLGYDISNEEEMNLAKEAGLFQTKCVQMIRDAVNILEELDY